MKRMAMMVLPVLAACTLLGGCSLAGEENAGQGGDLEKAQEIRAVRAGEEETAYDTTDRDAIEAFVESIHLLYPEPEPLPIVVFSAVADKDYEWMIAYLCRHLPAKLYIVTEIPDKRRVSAEELKKVFERYTDCEVVAKSDIGDALKEAYDRRGESEIYCLGSLYLVGAIKERIAGGNNHAELR